MTLSISLRAAMKRTISAAALAAVLTTAFVAPQATPANALSNESPIYVRSLTTEAAVNPIGVDEASPDLAWVLDSAMRSQVQTAYRVRVSSTATKAETGEADIWDSGKVVSAVSTGIAYGGSSLQSGESYYWTVQVWDGEDRASLRSPVNSWEMGLLSQADWHGASWIGGPELAFDSMTGSHWLWYPEGAAGSFFPDGRAYFRSTFNVEDRGSLASASIAVAADDAYKIYLNGEEVANVESVPNGWQSAHLHSVLSLVQEGANTIAVEVVNIDTTPAGFLAKLQLRDDQGAETFHYSDASWVSSKNADTGWQESGFDDTAWEPALDQGEYGGAIWGDRVTVIDEAVNTWDLRHEFTTDRPVISARAYATAGGYYELSIDGSRVGDRVLEPGFTLYGQRMLYSSYDVTDLVATPGAHAIGVSLGRGFYGLDPNDTAYYWRDASWLGEPRAKVVIRLQYEDGTSESVTSGTNWQAAPSPTVRDSIYLGETYDARLVQQGWNTPAFDGSGWAAAAEKEAPTENVRSQMMDPIRVVGELKSTEVSNPKQGTYVFKFPVMNAGWVKLNVEGERGTEVTLRYGETLRGDGTVNNDGDPGLTNGPVQTDRYILAGGGREQWQPRFSYKGFQYVQVDGYPGVPTENDVIAQIVHTDVDTIGEFESSNELLNQIHEISQRTIQINLHSVLTDSPIFEKRAWLGDANALLSTTTSNFDMQNFYRNWLYALRANQGEDGAGVEVTPGPETPRYWDPVWSGALVSMPWELYQKYGDLRALGDSYESMTAYVDYLETQAVGFIQPGHYGDWVAPNESGTWPWGPEGPRLTGTAYWYKYVLEVAEAAEDLGFEADESKYRQLASQIKTAFNAEFFDSETGSYRTEREVGYRQTSNAIPLTFGLVAEEHRESVAASLVDDVESRGFHLNTGFVGTKELLTALADNGFVDAAFRIATQTSYPSWGYWLSQDATSCWEAWHTGTRSRAHPFLCTIDDWFYTGLAGIKVLEPGYSEIEISPQLPTGLDEASGSIDTKRGEISSAWKRRTLGGYNIDVQVPVNSTAVLTIPVSDEQRVVEAGSESLGADIALIEQRGGKNVYRIGSGSYSLLVLSPGDGGTDKPELATPKISVKLAKSSTRYGQANAANVTVTADGTAAAGKVQVLLGTKTLVKSANLSAAGKLTVKLPANTVPGTPRLTVKYLGSGTVAAAQARADVKVLKAKPAVKAKLAKSSIQRTQRGKVTVTVKLPSASGVHVTGKLRILDGKKTIKTVTLKASNKGKITVTLPKLKKGTHKIRAQMVSSKLVSAAKSEQLRLRVR